MPPLTTILDIAAIALAALGLFGVAAALLILDRPRGRRRRPRCWYDLAAHARPDPTITCPGCGHRITRERSPARTRPRWRPAALALCVVLLATGWLVFRSTSSGWATLLPTSLLIELSPGVDDSGFLAGTDWVSLELGRRGADATMSAAQWKRYLLRTRSLAMRDRWPSDWPLAVRMMVPAWARNVRMVLLDPGAENPPTTAIHAFPGSWGGDLANATQPMPESVAIHQGTVDATFILSTPAAELCRFSARFQVEPVAGIDQVLRPIGDASLEARIRRATSVAVGSPPWGDGRTPGRNVLVALLIDLRTIPELREFQTHLGFDVLRGGARIGGGARAVSLPDDSIHTIRLHGFARISPEEWTAALRDRLPTDTAVMLRTDPRRALYDLEADRYLNGRVVLDSGVTSLHTGVSLAELEAALGPGGP